MEEVLAELGAKKMTTEEMREAEYLGVKWTAVVPSIPKPDPADTGDRTEFEYLVRQLRAIAETT